MEFRDLRVQGLGKFKESLEFRFDGFRLVWLLGFREDESLACRIWDWGFPWL